MTETSKDLENKIEQLKAEHPEVVAYLVKTPGYSIWMERLQKKLVRLEDKARCTDADIFAREIRIKNMIFSHDPDFAALKFEQTVLEWVKEARVVLEKQIASVKLQLGEA